MLYILFLYKLDDFCHFPGNAFVVFPFMGAQTGGAILNAALRIRKIAAALIAQCIQRTVAEQATEILKVICFVAGEIITFGVLEKIIIWHSISSFAVLE